MLCGQGVGVQPELTYRQEREPVAVDHVAKYATSVPYASQ
jgi:hypothetical protein